MGISGVPDDYDHEKITEEMEESSLLDDFYSDPDPERSLQNSRQNMPQFAVDAIKKLNPDQKIAFERIRAALSGNFWIHFLFLWKFDIGTSPQPVGQAVHPQPVGQAGKLFMGEGAGGCGKLWLYQFKNMN